MFIWAVIWSKTAMSTSDTGRLGSRIIDWWSLKNLCKINIVNAFDDLPLNNVEHGLMGFAPAEMLHMSGTGLLKYIFVSLCDLIGSEKLKKKEREQFDDLHWCLVQAAQCQSRRIIHNCPFKTG
jgi:hypothetical protein